MMVKATSVAGCKDAVELPRRKPRRFVPDCRRLPPVSFCIQGKNLGALLERGLAVVLDKHRVTQVGKLLACEPNRHIEPC
jgi:hypothetical protein